MSGVGAMWQQAADKWTELSDQITDADWDKPTTCDDWTVRDLVDHAMHWQGMGGGVIGSLKCWAEHVLAAEHLLGHTLQSHQRRLCSLGRNRVVRAD